MGNAVSAMVSQEHVPTLNHPREMPYPKSFLASMRQKPWRWTFRNHWFLRGLMWNGPLVMIFAWYGLIVRTRQRPAIAHGWAEKKRQIKEQHIEEEQYKAQKQADHEYFARRRTIDAQLQAQRDAAIAQLVQQRQL